MMKPWRGLVLAIITLFLCASHVLPAQAAPSRKDRYRALKIAGEALDLYRAGDYEPALKRFQEAYELVPAPTISLRIARCLDQLDRMQEAIDTYRQIIATELPIGAPPKHRKARKDAVDELAPLLEKQPSISVSVEGKDTAGVVVKIDGEVNEEVLSGPLKIDPGRYKIEASVGERQVSQQLNVARGQHPEVSLQLPDPPKEEPPPAPKETSSALPIAGWSLLGTGAAALVVGAVTGGVVLAQQDGLAERCPDRVCPPEAHDDARAFDRLRYTSTSMLVIGGVVAAVGSTLLVLAQTGDEEAAAADGDEASEPQARWSITPLLSPLAGVGQGGTRLDASQPAPAGAMLVGVHMEGTF